MPSLSEGGYDPVPQPKRINEDNYGITTQFNLLVGLIVRELSAVATVESDKAPKPALTTDGPNCSKTENFVPEERSDR